MLLETIKTPMAAANPMTTPPTEVDERLEPVVFGYDVGPGVRLYPSNLILINTTARNVTVDHITLGKIVVVPFPAFRLSGGSSGQEFKDIEGLRYLSMNAYAWPEFDESDSMRAIRHDMTEYAILTERWPVFIMDEEVAMALNEKFDNGMEPERYVKGKPGRDATYYYIGADGRLNYTDKQWQPAKL